jgi:hypothetical protein
MTSYPPKLCLGVRWWFYYLLALVDGPHAWSLCSPECCVILLSGGSDVEAQWSYMVSGCSRLLYARCASML